MQYLCSKRFFSNYETLDEKTEMYIVTETDTLYLFCTTDTKREQFVCLDDDTTTLVNFFSR